MLAQWKVGKIATLGARFTAQRLPLTGRSDYAVLSALAEYGDLSQADLGRHLVLDRNDVNAILNRLQDAVFIDRHPTPSDRRIKLVAITDAGTSHFAELQMLANDVQNELLKALDDNERQQLHVLLDKVLGIHGPPPS